jgi:micrococcal nuclease
MPIEFPETEFRARCLNVVDGDTVDLYVDIGFHVTFTGRFRILGVNTPEMNSKVPEERLIAAIAKKATSDWLKPDLNNKEWTLLVKTKKDPDNFGRWLASVSFFDASGTKMDLATQLLVGELAVPYKK